jgi:regulator of sigma E protease
VRVSLISFLFQVFLLVGGCIILILCVVGFHEAGHFVVARLFDVKVLRVAIGFGRILWKRIDKRGTEYAIAAIPLGGYVALLDSRQEVFADKTRALDRKPYYQRFLILIAGSSANFLFAWFAYALMFNIGFITLKPTIGEITPNSMAAAAKIPKSAQIISIDQQPTSDWMHVNAYLMMHYGQKNNIIIQLKHQNVITAVNIPTTQWRLDPLRPNPLMSLGIKPDRTAIHVVYYPFLESLKQSGKQMIFLARLYGTMLKQLFTGQVSWYGLSGPLDLLNAISVSMNHGWVVFMNLLALLSVSVGIVNLLPIPGLDGCQVMYVLYEWIFKRPVSVRVQVFAFKVTLIGLGLFMIQILLNDVLRRL